MTRTLRTPFANEYRNMILAEEYGLIFCPIPKVACSNWLITLRKAVRADMPFEKLHHRRKNGLIYIRDLPLPARNRTVFAPHLLRAVFVRNPWTRVLSAYRDKLENAMDKGNRLKHKPYVWLTIRGARILVKALGRPTLAGRNSISFEEFITLLEHTPSHMWNEHWRPQTLFAGIDRVPYDFVGRFENLLDDAAALVALTGLPPFHAARENLVPATESDRPDTVRRYYTPQLITRVGQLYRSDIELLGYTPPSLG